MRAIHFLLLTLFIPLITMGAGSTSPGVDPAITHYAEEVQGVWDAYRATSAKLGEVLAKLAENPSYIRENAFVQEVKGITWQIRQVTNYLASIDAPSQVKYIHDDLIEASDTFDAAAFMLDRFAVSHDFDDLAVGWEFLGAGLAKWQTSMDELNSIIGTSP